MECFGARNMTATMAVFSCPRFINYNITHGFSLLQHRRFTSLSLSSSLRQIKCSAKTDGCVVVKEGISEEDEEDYVKAGGSELLFVQMQQNKAMDSQSSLSDKLPQIPIGDCILDLVVIGCGPAGLALAAESAKLGLNVGLIGPDLPFTNNYGVWEDEFIGLGLEGCIEHVWRDTLVYLDDNDPILIGRAYGRVNRDLLHEELLKRCVESGVSYLSSKVERITEAPNGHSLIECEGNVTIPCRLATVASGAASGKLLQYELGGPRVCVQTAYDYTKNTAQSLEAEYPTFLYAMPMSPTKIFFEETCLASRDAMPFNLLKTKLMSRLKTLGIRIIKTYEEEWSYIPVGGSLPNTEQKNLAFGAAASMVHPATAWETLWPLERKRQRAFFLFGLALIVQLDIEGTRTFFRTFFRLPTWMWWGFLGSSLSSTDLVLFAFYMFIIAPQSLRMGLVRHLLSDPTGATMVRAYLTI
ncbi:Lycopene cyclase, beta/epsilon [Cynara cardunculus var. scolymus]|uniref:Lycopene cyclase, beta/epsilon n=1 Tax=Cynara cardunculus var. scolymus TaxID=59895 RepID=A0A103Y268_CYNCS|nr:Lycopene cyclase, beta/epsilon [Cynara cardunculus var. scolymus]